MAPSSVSSEDVEEFIYDNGVFPDLLHRRQLLRAGSSLTSSLLFLSLTTSQQASAASFFGGFGMRPSSSLYVVTPERNVTEGLPRETVSAEPYALSSELALVKLLPVKNPLLRELQDMLEDISSLSNKDSQDYLAWKDAVRRIETAISEIDKRRGTLEPPFNPDDDTILQIRKAEREEQVIENLRKALVDLLAVARTNDAMKTLENQKIALLALAEVGELLVSKYPYEVPTEGKFSYLPRLLGRAKVTIVVRRQNTILGNITIIADGYAAPITAGNFIDLCLRKFYKDLPIKFTKKRVGTGSEFEIANIPIFGSFNEGFYDPLTAKPRRIPLELVRVEKSTGVRELAYSQGLSSLTSDQAVLEPTERSKPVLSFDIPGLVAMNHPDKNLNGASSEFFGLQKTSMLDQKRQMLDGEYAPFGFIVGGFELFQELQPNDVIDDTLVDEWGGYNLIKLRRSSFSEVVQGTEDE